MTFRVAIIGGGYAGYTLARALDNHVDVTLIEARDAFVHNVAAIRAVADPNLARHIIFPYEKLLKKGRVLHSRVVSAEGDGVLLADGSTVPADVIVVATGSTYAAPFKPRGDKVAAFMETLSEVGRQVRDAEHIVIVGAGAVGVELAGEVKFAYPGKAVSLVSKLDQLFPVYPRRLHDALMRKLARAGVDLHIGDRAVDLRQGDAPYVGEVVLESGAKLAGLIVPATGSQIVTGPGQSLPGVKTLPSGQLAVDPWLRPSDMPNIFVLGDLAHTGEGMTVVAATRQADWLGKAIAKVAAGRKVEGLLPYRPWPVPPILLPLGPQQGSSVLPLSRRGMVVGDWLTSKVKGKSLFLPRYAKEFGRAH